MFSEDTKYGLSGFVCPECMVSEDSPEALLSHFEANHSSVDKLSVHPVCLTNPSSVDDFCPRTPVSQRFPGLDGSDKTNNEKLHLLLDELLKHNHRLIKRITDDSKRIFELESVLDLIVDDTALPQEFSFRDKQLEERINQYLERKPKCLTMRSEPETVDVVTMNGGLSDQMLKVTQDKVHGLAARVESLTLENISLKQQLDSAVVIRASSESKAVQIDVPSYENLSSSGFHELNATSDLSTTPVKLNELSDQIRLLQARLSETESLRISEKTALEKMIGTLEDKLSVETTHSKNSLALKDQALSHLESQLADKAIHTNQLSQELNSLNLQMAKLKTDNLNLTEKLRISEQRVEDLESEMSKAISAYHLELEKRAAELDDLRNSLGELRIELKASNARCDQLKERSKELADAAERSEAKLTESQMEFDLKLNDSKTQLILAKKEADSLLDRLMHTEDKCLSLEQQLSVQTKRLDELNKALFELGHENQSLQMLREKLTRRQWTRDIDAPVCLGCDREFSLSVRRHHCRNCGGVFCQTCSSNRAPTAASKDPVRVCKSCLRELMNR